MCKAIFLLCLVMLLALPGCMSVYQFEHTADRCALTVYTTRDAGGVDAAVDKDCALKGSAESLKTNEKVFEAIDSSLDTAKSLINKIP